MRRENVLVSSEAQKIKGTTLGRGGRKRDENRNGRRQSGKKGKRGRKRKGDEEEAAALLSAKAFFFSSIVAGLVQTGKKMEERAEERKVDGERKFGRMGRG